MIRTGGITGSRPYAYVFFGNQIRIAKLLDGGVTPIFLTHLGMQGFGQGLGQAIGQGFDHDGRKIIVVLLIGEGQVFSSKNPHREGPGPVRRPTALGSHKITQTKIGQIPGLGRLLP